MWLVLLLYKHASGDVQSWTIFAVRCSLYTPSKHTWKIECLHRLHRGSQSQISLNSYKSREADKLHDLEKLIQYLHQYKTLNLSSLTHRLPSYLGVLPLRSPDVHWIGIWLGKGRQDYKWLEHIDLHSMFLWTIQCALVVCHSTKQYSISRKQVSVSKLSNQSYPAVS